MIFLTAGKVDAVNSEPNDSIETLMGWEKKIFILDVIYSLLSICSSFFLLNGPMIFLQDTPESEKESESEVAQSCLTLWDLMDCSLPGSSVHGIFQARVLEWVAISFSKGSSIPTQGSNPGLPHCRQTLYHLSQQGSPGSPLLPCNQ